MPDRFHQLIAFWDWHFEGEHKHIFRTLPYIGDHFNDKMSSFAVLGGGWALYKDSNFGTAMGGIFSPRIRGYSWVEDYEVRNDSVSCVELLDDDSRPVPHLILFEEQSFRGKHAHIFTDVDHIERYASFKVLSGSWQVTTAGGNTFNALPGDGSDQLTDRLASLTLLSDTGLPPIPHVIVFWDANFEGDHRHIFTDTFFDDDWKDKISSFAIEGSTWQFFLDFDTQILAGQVLGPGIYPWVDDVEIPNDRIRAVLQTAQTTAIDELVAQSLNNGQDFLTLHGDPYRLGWNSHESTLTPDSVRVPYFGKLWFHPFDPDERVFGQILLASGVPSPPTGGPRDYLIAASAKNMVYALDPATGALVWPAPASLLLPDGVTPAAFLDSSQFSNPLDCTCRDTYPNHGVNSTPVIDKDLQIIYVAFLAQTGDATNFNQNYFLSAVSLVSGASLWTIELSWPGPPIPFEPFLHTQRAGLALLKASPTGAAPGADLVLIAFSSRCDCHAKNGDTWRGWLFAVPVTNGARPSDGSWQAVPTTVGTSLHDESGGGIWGPGGVAADDGASLYVATGNGNFNGGAGEQDFADSVLRFFRGNISIPPIDSYTPHNWQDLRDNDWDLGGSNPVLLPLQILQPGAGFLNLLVCGGKDGRVYVINREQMGFFHFPGSDGLGHAIWRPQVFSANADPSQGGITGSAAYFDAGAEGRYVYFGSSSGDPHHGLVAIKFDDLNGETHLGMRIIQFGGDRMEEPASPFVSSNGPAGGIVWLVESRRRETDNPPKPSILHAWDAVTGRLLYSSPLTTESGITGTGESLGDGRKFTPPIVANGRVFLGTNGVVAYGLGTTDPA